MADWILEVTQLNEYVRRSLEADAMLRSVRLRGEISNWRPNASGHVYFTLKDDRSRIGCVMFRSSAMRLSFRPRDGMAVVLSGRVGLYEATGTYQFYAEAMRPDGLGSLYQQFEALKHKLQEEGLFDEARKRPLPWRPRKIAVVTSRTGAVLHDICRVAGARDPGVPIVLLPVQVQGEGAAEEIAAAIRRAGRLDGVDVIITGRGGGSMEDLWAFNEEIVARAIAASPVPVISAVGHETDFTIADFAADRRASTPSNAAEMAVPDRSEIIAGLRGMRRHLSAAMDALVQDRKYRVLTAREMLQGCNPRQRAEMLSRRAALSRARLDAAMDARLNALAPRIAMAQVRLDAAADQLLQRWEERIRRNQARLQAINPENVLRRGYALVTDGERLLPDRASALAARRLVLRMRDGEMNVYKEEPHGSKKETEL